MVSEAQKRAQRKYMEKIKHTDHFIMLSRGYSSVYCKKRYETDDEFREERKRTARLYGYYDNRKDQILLSIRKLFE
jgi:hypothetical protein